MAIGKKIPSPQEVSKSPTSFSEEELNELKELKTKISELNMQFGQLYINKVKLEEQETILKKQLVEVETKETSIAKALSTKYGEGSINLETGTFTPS